LRRRSWHPCLLLALLLPVWWGSLYGEYVFDDSLTVIHNEVLGEWGKLFYAPTTSPLRDRPVAAASFQLNYLLGGREELGYHLFNLLVHLGAVLALYGVVRRSLAGGKAGEKLRRLAPEAALAAALLWGLHPLQTESVTYVTQRCESLAGLFYLLAFYLAIRGFEQSEEAEPRPNWWLVLSVVACFLGMGTKATVVTAPPALLLYDRVFGAGSFREIWRRRRWFYLGLFGSWAFQAWLLWRTDYPDIRTHTGWEYLRTQPGVVLHYLKLTLLPGELCLNYNWPPAESWIRTLPALLPLAGLVLLAVWGIVRGAPAGYALGWVFITLLPTSSILPLEDAAFEHRMYLPLAGLAALAGSAWAWWLAGLSRRRWGWGALAAVLVILGWRTWERNLDYRDPIAIWEQCLAVNPDNPRAHNNLGAVLAERGWPERGLEHYRRALELDPLYADAAGNLAVALAGKNDRASAAAARRYLALRPEDAGGWARLAQLLADADELTEAAAAWRAALRRVPANPTWRNELALTLMISGEEREAERELRRALAAAPNDVRTLVNLGALLGRMGRKGEARVLLEKASRLEPDHPALARNVSLLEETADNSPGPGANGTRGE